VPFQHGSEKQFCQMSERGDVELNLSEIILKGEIRKSSHPAVAGIVHEDINHNVFSLQLIEQKLGRGSSGKIECDGLSGNAELALKFIGKLSDLDGTARHQNEIVMIDRNKLGQFIPYAAGGAGDESGLRFCSHKECHPE